MAAQIAEACTDRDWMRLALRLARLGMGRTHPNPRVGAVAVGDGRLLGMGAHLVFGGPHAEAMLAGLSPEGPTCPGADAALRIGARGARAARSLEGATVYVNLEPCAHQGKTPPCASALALHGVRRVVAAIADPHPLVSGRGLSFLREAGVEVFTGLLAPAARRLNAPFLWHLQAGRAMVTLKLAASLDGRLAARDGGSRWISGEASRELVHRWRSECDAVVVGRGTFESDRPRLTARPTRDPLAGLRLRLREMAGGAAAAPGWPHQPVRLVVDSRARLGNRDDIPFGREDGGGPWIVACGARAPSRSIARLEARGAQCWRLPEPRGGAGVDLPALMRRLALEGLLDVLVEGGPALANSLLSARLVDRLRLFQAPCLLGGDRTWTEDLGVSQLSERVALARCGARRVGDDLLITGWNPALASLLDGVEAPLGDPEPCSRD
ncbi:MAG: bifunctional diaminohydroxyphosphoribosylaminopyrimidine deaminase/5-amino-6-(5-phosphoribosylamino)uracil reductase RibD [Candidatus Eisenbacteria bacterium]